MSRRREAFTLLEMLAVIFMTVVVLSVAVNFYLNLSVASNAAAESTRLVRRAASLLDRVARDLEGATLVVRPEGTDPLEHPWLFLAESRRGDLGAEQLKFFTRSHRARNSGEHESDLRFVSYQLRRGDGDSYELIRWSQPGLPESLDTRFPSDDDPNSHMMVDGLADFGVQLLGETGEWKDRWDSSQLVDSNLLPLAVEIQVAMAPDDPEDEVIGPFSRSVMIPVRPLDLEAVLAGEEAGEDDDEEEEGDEDCVTVLECYQRNSDQFEGQVEENVLQSILSAIGSECYADHGELPQVSGCE